MNTASRKTLLALLAVSLLLSLAACGNKGPLVRPSDVPPPADSGG
jgi:predicted small lipoprotein YifL